MILFVIRIIKDAFEAEARYVQDSFFSFHLSPPRLPSAVVLTGVGLDGLRCRGANAFDAISNCTVGSEASCRVSEPSDQRKNRALDCNSEGLEGECRHRIVDCAVL